MYCITSIITAILRSLTFLPSYLSSLLLSFCPNITISAFVLISQSQLLSSNWFPFLEAIIAISSSILSFIPYLFFSFSFSFFFGGGALQHMEFPGQGSDLSHSCHLGCSCGNARFLIHCAGPGIKPVSQLSQGTADPTAPQHELPYLFIYYWHSCKEIQSIKCIGHWHFISLYFT